MYGVQQPMLRLLHHHLARLGQCGGVEKRAVRTGAPEFCGRAWSGRTWTKFFFSGATCSWLSPGLGLVEGLGGLGKGVGDCLVPVHVGTAGAEFLRALSGAHSREGVGRELLGVDQRLVRNNVWPEVRARVTSAAPLFVRPVMVSTATSLSERMDSPPRGNGTRRY